MGKYYCEYVSKHYLTHDSMNARKAHNTGRNHIANVRDYFANLGRDGTQSHIDQIVNSHEGGGRAQMFAAPSMRLGAGFMNPMATAPQGGSAYPPFQGGAPAAPPFPPRPPFPPQQNQQFGGGGPPPFPPPGGVMPPFPPPGQNRGGPTRPPPNFTPQQGPPPGGNPGVHPDRMRMMNH
ncbi:hypothetical protein CC85DRAFT_284036 [Cutaneotrichosporon oleaginosum]|uniref:U1 small nuclear ribonucleoprotein C n=1 Tax=Cutaneotrichosporon oleaginosum TaxID=879819 RepID=A0A0J1B8A5_9TREE|nr:uncharacterized protein CC85DRAFT_284036 [Cutaneotrichosporon oleaginosum]KLT43999.1 hypothetical protein CC85DRAFT_284036 [Cutaneotrichosporon oleaginosum]